MNGLERLLRDLDRPDLVGEGLTQSVATAIADLYPAPSANGSKPTGDTPHQSARLTFQTLTDWRKLYTPPAWLIRGFITRDAFDVIGGAEKSLKSWLMHHCAIAVASGRDLFGDPTMPVPEPGNVLLLTGEGGVNLVLDRLEHLCVGMYGIDLDTVAERIIVSPDIAPMSSAHFVGDMQTALALYGPVLVQLDPMYVYLGEEREAGNVYSVGPALMALRALTIERALQTAHHFTKSAAQKLTLASLTQAGMREAVDHWLLISVDEHDLTAQRFVLDMERGARRGLAWSRRAEIILGPFDDDTLRHAGRPSFTWTARTAKASKAEKVEACAVAAVAAVKAEDATGVRGFTRTWVEEHIDLQVSALTKRAGIEQAVTRQAFRTEPGAKRAILHFYVKDYPQ